MQYLVKTKFPNGLPENQLRVWAGIQSKVMDAIATHIQEIDLDSEEVQLLKQCTKGTLYPSHIAKVLTIFLAELNKL